MAHKNIPPADLVVGIDYEGEGTIIDISIAVLGGFPADTSIDTLLKEGVIKEELLAPSSVFNKVKN